MKQRRRPSRVVHTTTVYYGGGRPPTHRFPWKWIGLGVLAILALTATGVWMTRTPERAEPVSDRKPEPEAESSVPQEIRQKIDRWIHDFRREQFMPRVARKPLGDAASEHRVAGERELQSGKSKSPARPRASRREGARRPSLRRGRPEVQD